MSFCMASLRVQAGIGTQLHNRPGISAPGQRSHGVLPLGNKWAWVKNRYPKWISGKWKHVLTPEVFLVVYFDPPSNGCRVSNFRFVGWPKRSPNCVPKLLKLPDQKIQSWNSASEVLSRPANQCIASLRASSSCFPKRWCLPQPQKLPNKKQVSVFLRMSFPNWLTSFFRSFHPKRKLVRWTP